MHRILIVDDEAVEREVVRFLLNQYHFSLEIQEAVNGKEALNLLYESSFDILFTDIRMPFLDGLALASQARALYPDIHIIFFSGYDDFTYVKEALALHVVNYILKPIHPEEFQKTISDVLSQIHAQEERDIKQKTALDFTRNHVLYQLIHKTDVAHLERLYPHLDLSFVYECHQLLLIQLEHDFFGTESGNPNIGFFPTDLKPLLPKDCYFINLNPAQNLILFAGSKRDLQWYQKLADTIAAKIEMACHTNCFIAISMPFSHPNEISDAYETTEKQLVEHFFFTESTVDGIAQSKPVAPAEHVRPENDDAIIKQLQMDIQFKDPISLKEHMILLIRTFKNKKNLSHVYFRFLCTNVLKLLMDGLAQKCEESFDEYASIIYHSDHLSEIESLLLRLTELLAAELVKEQESPNFALQLVKQYIHNHYDEDLSLDILAREVYLTPRYLSALFIEENDCGINRYIKNIRMEKAQELLLTTNLKVSDICKRVGYSNLSYFCKSFAEEFGATPDRFRQQKSQPIERSK